MCTLENLHGPYCTCIHLEFRKYANCSMRNNGTSAIIAGRFHLNFVSLNELKQRFPLKLETFKYFTNTIDHSTTKYLNQWHILSIQIHSKLTLLELRIQNRLGVWQATRALVEFLYLCDGTSNWPSPYLLIQYTFEIQSILFLACHQSERPTILKQMNE